MAEHAKEIEEIKRPLSLYMAAMKRLAASPLTKVLADREKVNSSNASLDEQSGNQ